MKCKMPFCEDAPREMLTFARWSWKYENARFAWKSANATPPMRNACSCISKLAAEWNVRCHLVRTPHAECSLLQDMQQIMQMHELPGSPKMQHLLCEMHIRACRSSPRNRRSEAIWWGRPRRNGHFQVVEALLNSKMSIWWGESQFYNRIVKRRSHLVRTP